MKGKSHISVKNVPHSSQPNLVWYITKNQFMKVRYYSRFFVQVGHEDKYVPSGNHHFFTISWHRQTYQNYQQPSQRPTNSDFQSRFLVLKLNLSDLFFLWRIFDTETNFLNTFWKLLKCRIYSYSRNYSEIVWNSNSWNNISIFT